MTSPVGSRFPRRGGNLLDGRGSVKTRTARFVQGAHATEGSEQFALIPELRTGTRGDEGRFFPLSGASRRDEPGGSPRTRWTTSGAPVEKKFILLLQSRF